MSRLQVCVLSALVALAGCGDDGVVPPGDPPDTVLDATPAALSNQTLVTFEFSAIGEANEFQCSLDSGAVQRCTSPREITVSDGPHTFAVSALNRGTPDESPALFAWTVDTIPPDSQITNGPPSFDNSTMVDFTFTGSPITDIARFECALDGGTFATCTSPSTLTSLVSGLHSFQVRAVDAAGNNDPTPSVRSWTIDTSTPDTMITSGPAEGSTQASTATLSFSSPDAAAVFECSFNGGPFSACTSPTVFNNLTTGTRTFLVRAKNVTTNVVDPTPASRMWTVDATPPTVVIDTTPSNPTNDATPDFTFSSPATDIASFECQIDGVVTFAPCTSPYVGASTPDGTRTFRVRATDNVGNQGTTSHTWIIDTVAPTVTITGGPSGTIGTGSGTFTFSTAGFPTGTDCSMDAAAFTSCTSPYPFSGLADGTHTFVVRATDAAGNSNLDTRMFDVLTIGPTVAITGGPSGLTNNGSPMFTFTTTNANTIDCRMDGGTFAACTSPFSTSTLTQGMHTFQVRVRDLALNTATDSRSFTVDTIPPTVTILAGPSGPTNDVSPTFTFLTGGSPTSTECRFDTQTFAACTSPYTAVPDLGPGNHVVEVRVTDLAGNTSFDTRTFSVITVGPTVTIDSGPTGATSDSTPSWTFTTGGAPTAVECRLDGGAYTACTSPYDAPLLVDGGHTFEVRVTDAASNSSSASRSIIVDTMPPTVAINAGPSGPTNDSTPTFGFVANGATTILCRITGAYLPCTSPHTTAMLPDGPYVFDVLVSDDAGNSTLDSRAFSVDTDGPIVTINSGPTGSTTDNTPTFGYAITGAFVTEECRIDTGTFSPCSSPFTANPLGGGMHTFEVRVVDDAGNADTDTRTFDVMSNAPTVTITIGPNGNCGTSDGAPAATCNPTNVTSPSFTFTAGAGWSTIQCRFDSNSFVNCNGAIPAGQAGTSSFMAGTVLGNGGHFFEVQACNASSNCASDVRPFTVDSATPSVFFTGGPIDATSGPATPTNSLPQNFTYGTAGTPAIRECRVAPGASAGGTFAVCTTTTTYVTNQSTDGQYTVQVRVRDAAFNFAAVSRTFTVDRTAPVINITAAPPSVTKSPAPNYVFSTSLAQEPHPGVFQCSVDGGAFATCTSPFTPPSTEGAHTFQIRMTDLAGNTGTTAIQSYIVDTIAPTVTITPLFPNPLITNNLQPAFNIKVVNTGGGPLPITVTCAFNAAPGNCSIPMGADFLSVAGVNITPSGPLSDLGGTLTHNLTITATDVSQPGGNQGSASRNFTIDTVAPTVTGISLSPPTPSQVIPTVSFTPGDDRLPTFPLQSVTCRVDAQTPVACTTSFTATGITDGLHTYQITVVDAAGTSHTTNVGFRIDNTDPNVTIMSGPGPGNPTNNVSSAFGFSVGNPGTDPSNIVSATCSFSGPTPVTCAVTGVAPFTTATAAPVGTFSVNGTYTLTVTSTDEAGNFDTDTRVFLVDTVPPVITIGSPADNGQFGAQPNLAFSINDGAGAGVNPATRLCSVNGGTAVACTSPHTFAALPDANNHTYTVSASDLAGNVGTPITVMFTLDTAAPSLMVMGGPTSGQVFPGANAVPAFNISVTDLTSGTLTCTLNGVPVASFGAPNTYAAGSDTDTCTLPTNLVEGNYTVAITATDSLAHTTAPGFSRSFSVDTTPPTLSISSPLENAWVTTGSPTITYATNGSTCAVNGGAFAACGTSVVVGPHADGNRFVTIESRDSVANATTLVRNFKVDTINPVVTISAPADGSSIAMTTVAAFNVMEANGTTVTCKLDAAAAGPCTAYTAPNGTFNLTALAAGSHTLVVTATDESGRIGSDTNTFTVVDTRLAAAAGSLVVRDATTSAVLALTPTYAQGTLSYTIDVPLSVDDVTITASASDGGTTDIEGQASVAFNTPSAAIALALGANALEIDVTRASLTTTYTVTVTRAALLLQQTLKASNPGTSDLFGLTVAMSGDTLAVAARTEDSSSTGINGVQADESANAAGAVYVFTRSGSTWTQQAYLKASNTNADDFFGFSLAIDGNTLAVGAPFEDSNATGINGDQADNAAMDAGAVYVFTRSGTTWMQEAYVKASNTGAGDRFGQSVSLSGSTLAVGSRWEASNAIVVNGNQADNSAPSAGAVYVFTRSGVTWTQEAYLKPTNTASGDEFGYAVDLDVDTLAISSRLNDLTASNSGAGYIFVRSGVTWTQEAFIKASNPGADDQFGASVALSGNSVVFGAPLEDSSATTIGGIQADEAAVDAGAAYVFTRSGMVWTQQAYIKSSGSSASDFFGSVDLAGDTLVIGAAGESRAYVFVRNPSWTEAKVLVGTGSLGDSVAISTAGDYVACGASAEGSVVPNSGGSLVFH